MWNVAILALIPGLTLVGHAAVPAPPSRAVATAGASATSKKPAAAPAEAQASLSNRSAAAGAAAVPVQGRPTPEQGEALSRGLLRMTITAATERIPLPPLRAPMSLLTDALARRIRLTPSKGDNLAALHARISKHVGFLCPKVEVKFGAVELTCRTGRFEAQINRQGKDWYLDINELRGLPWRPGPDAPPSYFYDPFRVGLGQSCPGKAPAARGECELKNGHVLEAAVQFRAALDTTARQMGCVRLGDLALATGDPITAAGWYRRAGSFGIFGRVADARLCELDGRCLQSTEKVLHAFDVTGMPDPLRAETTMRAARAEAYLGRLPAAAGVIAKQIRAHGAASICREAGELLCRRIWVAAMLEADSALGGRASRGPRPAKDASNGDPAAARALNPRLEKPERDYLEELVETYLAFPSWEKGALAVEMGQAAAPLAARLGAPMFGGNLLAALAPQVPDARLADHLLLTAETFLGGDNWARARIVVEYAQSRLTGKSGTADGVKGGLQGPRWAAVLQLLNAHAAQDEVSNTERAAVEAEFKVTLSELKRARQIVEQADVVLSGTRDAQTRTAGAAPATPPVTPPPGRGTAARTGDDRGSSAAPANGEQTAAAGKSLEAER